MIKKIIIATVLFLFILNLNPNPSFANEDFSLSADVKYTVNSNGVTNVSQKITIINKKEFVYTPSYKITLKLKNISDAKVSFLKENIPFTISEKDTGIKEIEIKFPEKNLGIGKKNEFILSFNTTDYLVSEKNVYTLTIPGVENLDTFDFYNLEIITPNSFPELFIIKPTKTAFKNGNIFKFSKSKLSSKPLQLIFGDSQYYKLKIKYFLENKNLYSIKTEIALVPKTNYQDVILTGISMLPENIHKDIDGNVLATYRIKPKTTYIINAELLVKVLAQGKVENIDKNTVKNLIKQDKYWEVESYEIKKISKNLASASDIFAYVVKSLSYSLNEGKSKRLGAKNALSNPFYALCLEYTDLFIALSRAKGIPSRAVLGYVYSSNINRPVSLYEDNFHSWPEYYDKTTNTWKMVDPTWTDTTSGIDYFNSLDFEHITFIKNGSSSSYPVLPSRKNEKNVSVEIINKESFIKKESLFYSAEFSQFLQNGHVVGELKVKNKGNFEPDPKIIYIFIDNKKAGSVTVENIYPYATIVRHLNLKVPGKNTLNILTKYSYNLKIQDIKGNILFEKKVAVFPFPLIYLIGGAIFFATVIISFIAIKTRSLPFQR